MITRYVHSEVNENPYCFYFALDTKTGVMRIKFEQHLQWPRDVRIGWIKQRPMFHIVDDQYHYDKSDANRPMMRPLTELEQGEVMNAFNTIKHELPAIRKELKNANQA